MTHLRVLVTAWRAATPEVHGAIIRTGLMAAVASTVLMGRPTPTTVTLVHGDYRLRGEPAGGDNIAAEFARSVGWTVEPHPARNHPTQYFGQWPGCGPARNTYMISLGGHLLVAFPGPDSKGTRHCMSEAVGRIPLIYTVGLDAAGSRPWLT